MKRLIVALLSLALVLGDPSRVSASTVQDACSSFSVSGNQITCVPNNAAPVQVPTQPQPPVTQPSTPGAISCPGFDNTIVLVANWANQARLLTATAGHFGAKDIVVVQFTTGSVESPSNSLPRFVAAEYQSAPSTRIAVLSATPCDFSAQAVQGATTSGTTVTIPFTVANANNYGYYPILNTNATYYLNIKNAPSSSCTASDQCDIAVDLTKPGGM